MATWQFFLAYFMHNIKKSQKYIHNEQNYLLLVDKTYTPSTATKTPQKQMAHLTAPLAPWTKTVSPAFSWAFVTSAL